MARLTPQTNRFDPFRNFGSRSNGTDSMSRASRRWARSNEPPRWWSSARPARTLPAESCQGKTTYQAVTLEAGITYDTAFEDWANLVNDFASHSITSLGEFRKNIIVDVFNEAGQKSAFVSSVQLLGFGVSGAARSRCRRERRRYHHHETRSGVLGARPGRG